MNLLRGTVHCSSCTSLQIQTAWRADLADLPLAAAIVPLSAFVGTAVAAAVVVAAAAAAFAASAAVAAAAAAAVVVETIGVLALAFAVAAVAAVGAKECLA